MGKGNSLAGSEKMKTPSIRIHEDELDAFDEHVEENTDWESRTEAIRALMKRETGREPAREGRQPPVEPELAKAYGTIRQLTKMTDGWVPADVAEGELSQRHGMNKKSVRRMLLTPLRKRGYVDYQSDLSGYSAVRARL